MGWAVVIPLQVDPDVVAQGVNYVWIFVVSFLVFFMQPGSALLEVGQIRTKSVGSILMKNMTDWALGVLVCFLVGAKVTTIVGGLTSPGGFDVAAAFSYIGDSGTWIDWLFGAVFAMTAATTVSGAVAEHMGFHTYIIFAMTITGFIYPVMQGLTWSGGLLSSGGYIDATLGVGYLDFAGATVVHIYGDVAGLIGAKIVGPHKGRFDSNDNSQPIPDHSMLLAVLGTLILAFGWYGFNISTQATVLAATDNGGLEFMGAALGRIALVTTLGIGAGAVATMIVSVSYQGKPDPLWMTNGLFAGLVATAGTVLHVTWQSGLILGALGGTIVLPAYRWTVDPLRIDNAYDVLAVHDVTGTVGTTLIPIFTVSGFSDAQLMMQVVDMVVIATWTIIASTVVFAIADAVFGPHVSEKGEEEDLSADEYGVSVYPEFVGDAGLDGALGSPTTTNGGSDVRTDGGVEQDRTVEANGGDSQ